MGKLKNKKHRQKKASKAKEPDVPPPSRSIKEDVTAQEDMTEEHPTSHSDAFDLRFIRPLGGQATDLKLLEDLYDDEDEDEIVLGEGKSVSDAQTLQEAIESRVKKLGLTPELADQMATDEAEGDDEAAETDQAGTADSDHADEPTKPSSHSLPGTAPEDRGGGQADTPVPWFDAVPPLSVRTTTASTGVDGVDLEKMEVLDAKYTHAQQAYQSLVQAVQEQQLAADRSGVQWARQMMRNGTLSDKIAVMTLAIQKHALSSLQQVDALVNFVKRQSKREFLLASEALVDVCSVLLPDRKLVSFASQPLTHPDITPQHLAVWYFEDSLKLRYAEYVKNIERWTHDPLAHTRSTAMKAASTLLSSKPEQEGTLLNMIINKLGDQEKKVASRAGFLLQTVLQRHPAMAPVVVRETERFVFRPNVGRRAQYYAITFLNQTILTSADVELARSLMRVYLTLFKAYMGKDGDQNLRLMSAVLSGVNRAYPFSKADDTMFAEHVDSVVKAVHTTSFNTAVQALALLLNMVVSSKGASSRFYRAMYSKLLDPDIRKASKQGMFLGLFYRAVKADPQTARMVAMIKRLLQVAHYCQPPFVCGALLLLSELLKARPQLWSHVPACTTSNPSSANGVEESDSESDEEEEEEEEEEEDEAKPEDDGLMVLGLNGGEEQDVEESDAEQDTPAPPPEKSDEPDDSQPASEAVYDWRKRDPLYAGADTEMLWELTSLAVHFHPSVSIFAQTILERQPVVYAGDPMEDFTLMHFLDRFSYRNPKKTKAKGISLMQKHRQADGGLHAVAVNEPAFVQAKAADVPEHESFFHRFFSERERLVKEGRTLYKPKRLNDEDEDDLLLAHDADESDEEEEDKLDAIADDLAEDLLRQQAGLDGGEEQGGPDIDDESFDSDAFADAMQSDGDDSSDELPSSDVDDDAKDDSEDEGDEDGVARSDDDDDDDDDDEATASPQRPPLDPQLAQYGEVEDVDPLEAYEDEFVVERPWEKGNKGEEEDDDHSTTDDGEEQEDNDDEQEPVQDHADEDHDSDSESADDEMDEGAVEGLEADDMRTEKKRKRLLSQYGTGGGQGVSAFADADDFDHNPDISALLATGDGGDEDTGDGSYSDMRRGGNKRAKRMTASQKEAVWATNDRQSRSKAEYRPRRSESQRGASRGESRGRSHRGGGSRGGPARGGRGRGRSARGRRNGGRGRGRGRRG